MKTIAQALEANKTNKITRNVLKKMVEGSKIQVNDSAEYLFYTKHCPKFSSGVSLELPITSGGWRTMNFKNPKECAEWLEKNLIK